MAQTGCAGLIYPLPRSASVVLIVQSSNIRARSARLDARLGGLCPVLCDPSEHNGSLDERCRCSVARMASRSPLGRPTLAQCGSRAQLTQGNMLHSGYLMYPPHLT